MRLIVRNIFTLRETQKTAEGVIQGVRRVSSIKGLIRALS